MEVGGCRSYSQSSLRVVRVYQIVTVSAKNKRSHEVSRSQNCGYCRPGWSQQDPTCSTSTYVLSSNNMEFRALDNTLFVLYFVHLDLVL